GRAHSIQLAEHVRSDRSDPVIWPDCGVPCEVSPVKLPTMADNSNQLVDETIELLKDFKSNLYPCIYSVKALLAKLKSNELDTDDGISLFDLKNKMFVSYLVDLADVFNTKLSGGKLPEHPALERLVE